VGYSLALVAWHSYYFSASESKLPHTRKHTLSVMQSTTAVGQRKGLRSRGDSTTGNSGYHHGAGAGTSTVVGDSTQPITVSNNSSDDDSPDVIAMKDEITGRFVSRGPSSKPVKGTPRKPTGSQRRDRHHQPSPGSSVGCSNVPPKGHPPATTATQPTTAGRKKRPL